MGGELNDWIGKTVTRRDLVTRRLMDEYRATLAPHLHAPADDGECLPGFHWCLALPAHETDALGPDGTEAKGLFLPPVALSRRMWAGGAVETFRPFRLGDEVTRVSTVSDIKERQGRSGALCVISVTHEMSTGGGLALRERHDILYRDAPVQGGAKQAAAVLPDQGLRWEVDATPLLLFRFSAVTFNGHRIHYDLAYARETEGYDGLLVHGPLQAALLMNQIAVLRRAAPRRFTYRCTNPLVAGQCFTVRSWSGSGGAAMGAITDAAGIMTIEAEAHG
jgi:3-methylfumaryl-CoA hydratase